jgi:three-Cys-motif partner protein
MRKEECMKTNNRLILNRAIEPDTHPHLVLDRGKNEDGVGDWVYRDKHRMLATYIDAARSAANSSSFSNWIYLDPFCGAGRMQVREEKFSRPSGAMVAWRQSQISSAPFDQVFVGDLDDKKLGACEERLRAAGCPVQSFQGAAAMTVHEMVKAVPARSLCLVYLDPYNLSLLSYQMISAFAKLPKVDFVVHFSTMDWLRNVANARPCSSKIRRCFPRVAYAPSKR